MMLLLKSQNCQCLSGAQSQSILHEIFTENNLDGIVLSTKDSLHEIVLSTEDSLHEFVLST